jgi:hypothetical protein
MKRLITDESLEKWVLPEVRRGTAYRPVFEYAEERGDIHVYNIGFQSSYGRHTAEVFIPSVREDGMLQRNRTIWFPVNLMLPPVNLIRGSVRQYLSSLLSADVFASKATEFFPEPANAKVQRLNASPLYSALSAEEEASIDNLYKWIVLTPEMVIIEMFNLKITYEIERSTRGGFTGISSTQRAIHTLIRAIMRWHRSDDDDMSESVEDLDEGDIGLGSLGYEDKKGVLLIHPLITEANLDPDGPVDFCTCSNSKPIMTARIKDGVRIGEVHLEGKPTFPYCAARRAVVGILNDDPHRVIVSRSITRSLDLVEPDRPYVETEVVAKVDTLSMPGIRIAHPLTCEDGIVVSETFARKAGCFKTVVDRLVCTKESEVEILKQAVGMSTSKAKAIAAWDMKETTMVIQPGDAVASQTYVDCHGELQVRRFRSSVKVPSVLVEVEVFEPEEDIRDLKVVRFVQLSHYPLEVGDKLSDAHGNKGTVSAIWPDEKMPVWKGADGSVQVHYMAEPFVMKRLAGGAEIEDMFAMVAFTLEKRCGEKQTLKVNSDDAFSFSEVEAEMDELCCSHIGSAVVDSVLVENVCLSLRQLFRLDNLVRDTVSTRLCIPTDQYGRTGNNIRLGLDIITMLTRGARNLVHRLVEDSKVAEGAKLRVSPILSAVSGNVPEGALWFKITQRIPSFEILDDGTRVQSGLLNRPFAASKIAANPELLNDTAADERLATHYGVFELGKYRIVVPPCNPLVDLQTGQMILSPISTRANRAIAEILSENRVGSDFTQTAREIETYRKFLQGMLCGKGGLLRSQLFPVAPVTIRAVASCIDTDDPLEIRIPHREFARILASEYTQESVRELYKDRSRNLVMVKRDPVHHEDSLVTVRFRTWSHNTIGMSPLLMKGMYGDFDGDAVVVMFAPSAIAYHDLKKLLPGAESLKMPKQLKGCNGIDAIPKLRERVFGSSFRHPSAYDECKNPQMLEIISSPSHELISREAIAAARDFEIIKRGTANVGALALRFIFTRKAEDVGILSDAMYLYHVLAQNTLDAKSGVPVPALEVVSAFAQRGKSAIALAKALAELGYTRESCTKELIEFSNAVANKKRGMGEYLIHHAPVLGAMQRAIGKGTLAQGACTEITKRLATGGSLGEGFWDSLYDFVTGRCDSNIFKWDISFSELFSSLANPHKGRTSGNTEGA